MLHIKERLEIAQNKFEKILRQGLNMNQVKSCKINSSPRQQ